MDDGLLYATNNKCSVKVTLKLKSSSFIPIGSFVRSLSRFSCRLNNNNNRKKKKKDQKPSAGGRVAQCLSRPFCV